MEGYSPVWQSWDLVTVCNQSTERSENNGMQLDPKKNMVANVREDVQKARIAKGLSISALASLITCDIITLADFERGNDILPENVHKRLLKELELIDVVTQK